VTEPVDLEEGPALEEPVLGEGAQLMAELEALRPPIVPVRPRATGQNFTLASHVRVLLSGVLLAVVLALLTWPSTFGGGGARESVRVSSAAGRTAAAPKQAPSTTTTTVMPAPEQNPVPALVPVTQPAPSVPSTTTTTTRPTTTTTTRPAPPPPATITPTSASAVGSGVQLTLSAAPPDSGAARTAVFRLDTEFGDPRVLRGISLDLGDDTTLDGPVQSWACFDPGAPNPYVFNGPTHTYAPGRYVVMATVRTAACVEGGESPPEETARVQLTLIVS
jgi:hypothetical protein